MTKEEEQIIVGYIESIQSNPNMKKMIEEECGVPIKATFNWEKRELYIRGPKGGRKLNFDSILQEFNGLN